MKQLNKKNKIIICSIGIVVGLAIILCSIFLINSGTKMNGIPSGNTQNSQQPSMPSGSNSSEPPDNSTTNGSSSSDSRENNQGPTNGSQNSKGPSSSDSKNSQGPMNNSGTASSINNTNSNSNILKIIGIVAGSLILSLSLIYLIMSKFGTNNIFTSLDKIIIYILINIILTACLTFGINTLSNKYLVSNNIPSMPTENNNTTNNDSTSTETSTDSI